MNRTLHSVSDARSTARSVPDSIRPLLLFATTVIGFAAASLAMPASFSNCLAADGMDEAATYFETRIRPLLLDRCAKCHGPNKQEAGLRVDRASDLFRGGESGRAIEPNKPDESRLLTRVRARGDEQMPPDTRLTDEQIASLERWVRDGAVWPDAKGVRPAGSSGMTPPEHDKLASPIEPNDASLAGALQLWLRADRLSLDDGAPVVVWPDASGRGRDVTATAGVREGGIGRPPTFIRRGRVNGRPAVRFRHESGMAGSPDHRLPISGDAPLTIFIVVRLSEEDAGTTHDSVLFIGNPAHAGDPGRPLSALIEIETANRQLDLAGGWGHDASLGAESAQTLFDEPGALTITRQPGPWTAGTKFFWNGRTSHEVWGRDPSGSNETPDIQHRPDIGVSLGKPQAWAGGFSGDLCEVIVFDRVLSDDERRGVEAALAGRYDLLSAESLAAAHRTFTDEEKSFWSFQPVSRPTVPNVEAPGESAPSPIDRFVRAKLAEAGLAPSPPADRRTLIRRLTFDLIGLPPTPDEIEQFIVDERPDAYERLVDRLLASPRYGERWARHWLDVVRYAETTANDANAVMRYAWRYRDYVIRAFNDDLPYDQFVREQIAGDLLAAEMLDAEASADGRRAERRRVADQTIASGFLMLGPKALAETDKEQSRLDIIDDQLDVIGRAMLGLTISCARCHDHKFDPIPTVDYYSLAGILRGTEVFRDEVRNASMWEERPVESPGIEPLVVMAPRDAMPVSLRVHQRGDKRNPGIIAPRRFLQVIAGEGRSPLTTSESGRRELAEWLASPAHPLTARVIVNRVWQHHFGAGLVATSDNFGSRGERPSHPELLDWLAAELVESGWSIKSLHRTMVCSQTYRASSSPGADALAIDPDNRLLWRMPIRRLDAESLRDAMLAVAGELDAAPGGAESGEFLFERGEVIDANRDFFRPNRVQADDPFYTMSRRRSVYLPVVRNAMPDLFALFDGADPNGVTPLRNDTTVPSQALFLMNHPFVREQAMHMAERLLAGSGGRGDARTNRMIDAARIQRGYLTALGRQPRDDEIASAAAFLDAYEREASATSRLDSDAARLAAWQSFFQTLLCRNEFLYIE